MIERKVDNGTVKRYAEPHSRYCILRQTLGLSTASLQLLVRLYQKPVSGHLIHDFLEDEFTSENSLTSFPSFPTVHVTSSPSLVLDDDKTLPIKRVTAYANIKVDRS